MIFEIEIRRTTAKRITYSARIIRTRVSEGDLGAGVVRAQLLFHRRFVEHAVVCVDTTICYKREEHRK